MAEGPARAVYFSQVEPHDPGSLKRAVDLRASLLLHLIFTPRIVIGDAQVLNNPVFRSLLSGPTGEPAQDSEVASLLAGGELVIAKRAGLTLEQIQTDHEARRVHGVPPREYARFLDSVATPHLWEWDEDDVAEQFKSNAVRRLDEALAEDASGDLRAARDWVASREQLRYHDLRQHLTSYDERTAAVVDQLVGIEYSLSLPSALQTPMADSSTSRCSPFTYLSLDDQLEQSQVRELPCWILRPEALAKLPVAAVREAAQLQASREVKAQLGRIEVGLEPDVAKFQAGLVELVERLEASALDFAVGRDAEALAELRDRPAKLRLWKSARNTAAITLTCLGIDVFTGGIPSSLSLLAQLVTFGASVKQEITDDRARERAADNRRRELRINSDRSAEGIVKRIVLPISRQ
ncbi:hypothetical protein AB0L70_11275 [Kribbella sp. NPDC051952]|uniref:hypothetical protein n=1 Tax=Kribbella sp. NPDC051952 TaxID=3154851 RepID=UPI0034156E31